MAILRLHLTLADSANVTAALAFWLLPGIGLFWWILSYYEDARKGARVTGFVLFAATFLYFVIVLELARTNVHTVAPGVSQTIVP
jgi:hypothetical protein